jgi:hypothetical protein
MKAVSGLKYYVPVTVVGDNPKATNSWKRSLAGLPARNNYHLFKRDELQIQTFGNVFFVGWSKPIPLLSTKNRWCFLLQSCYLKQLEKFNREVSK